MLDFSNHWRFNIEKQQHKKIRKIVGLLFAYVFIIISILGNDKYASSKNMFAEEESAVGPSCRYGVASIYASDTPFVAELNAGWTIDFSVNFNRVWPSGVTYSPVVRIKQAKDPVTGARLPTYIINSYPLNDDPGGLGALVTANPGLLWMVGNEVDRVAVQDDIMPDIYAIAYHDIYHFIKDRDPSALVAISGLVEVTPGRLQYLDIVWDSYIEKYGVTIPVDVWNMHIYILPEIRSDGIETAAYVALGTNKSLAILESGNNPALCPLDNVYCYAEHDDTNIFLGQIRAMRQWMKNHGLQDKPLILSEFSLLYPYDGKTPCYLRDEFGGCFTPTRVSNFMVDTFAILENTTDSTLGYPQDNYRLVQKWLWFAVNDRTEYTPNALVNLDQNTGVPISLSTIGQVYKNLASTSAFDVNLIPSKVSSTTVFTTSAVITAEVRNNGGVPVNSSFIVSFYSDSALTNLIDEVVVANLAGCAVYGQTISVIWNGLTPNQVNHFWVKVDSSDLIVEVSESDNIASGFVIVDPKQVFLPITSR